MTAGPSGQTGPLYHRDAYHNGKSMPCQGYFHKAATDPMCALRCFWRSVWDYRRIRCTAEALNVTATGTPGERCISSKDCLVTRATI